MHIVSSIGRPKHVRVMAGALEGDTFLGPKAEVWAVLNFNTELKALGWEKIIYIGYKLVGIIIIHLFCKYFVHVNGLSVVYKEFFM